MQEIAPDFNRMIDLPGVGPCPRPVDIDQSVTGFADLVSLRIYKFSGDTPIMGEAEDDEVLIVLVAGGAAIHITGDAEADYQLSVDGIRAVYLPPEHHYQLTPDGSADVAYMRAKPREPRPPEAFSGPDLAIEDYADRLRLRLVRLGQDALPVTTSAGEGAERLVFLSEGAQRQGGDVLSPWHTLALGKGESARLSGRGEALIVSALSGAAGAAP